MLFSMNQIRSDEMAMTAYICERLTKDPTRVVLASGEDGETWADLYPIWVDTQSGWELVIETSDEHVGLEEVYDHYRRQELTHLDFRREIERQLDRSKVITLENEVRKLRSYSEIPHWDRHVLSWGHHRWFFRGYAGPVRSLLNALEAKKWRDNWVLLDFLGPEQVRDAAKLLRRKTRGVIIWHAASDGLLTWAFH